MIFISARDLLESLKNIDEEIDKDIDKVCELRSMATNMSVSYDKENVQSSSSKDKMGEVVSKIVDMEDEINAKADGLVERKKIAKRIIFKIKDEKKQNILYDYYICNRSLVDVADEYELTYKNCKVIKGRAVKEFERLYIAEYGQYKKYKNTK